MISIFSTVYQKDIENKILQKQWLYPWFMDDRYSTNYKVNQAIH